MSDWERSQEYEKTYNESDWSIPFSEKYWLDFMKIDSVNAPALEVGCGKNGIFKFNRDVTGLDPIKVDATNFICAKAEDIPFSNNFFEDVYCINSLDHTENPERAMKEMMRVCNDRLIIWTYIFPDASYKRFYAPHPHALTLKRFLNSTYKDFEITKLDFIDIFDEFSRHKLRFKYLLKIAIADIMGVEAILVHMRRKYGRNNSD